MNTLGVTEAAALLRMSPDALMRKARAGIIPGAKVGRRWVFVHDDLIALIREQAKARECHFIGNPRARIGGFDSQSVDAKLDGRLAQLTGRLPSNSRANFALISGGKSSSESDHGTHGPRPSSTGTNLRAIAPASRTGRS